MPATLSIPNPEADHCRHMPPLETPGHSQASLGQSLVGSLLLPPGSWCTQSFVCVLQESVSLVLCKFWWLYGGLMATSSERAYAIPRSVAPRAPAPAAGHCWPVIPQDTQTQVWLSFCGDSWCTQGFVWALQVSLVGMRFDSKCDFAPPTVLPGVLLCLWMWSIVFWWDTTFSRPSSRKRNPKR